MVSGSNPAHLFRVRNTFLEPILALQDEHEEAQNSEKLLLRTFSDSTLQRSDKPVFEMNLLTPTALRETCVQSDAKHVVVATDSPDPISKSLRTSQPKSSKFRPKVPIGTSSTVQASISKAAQYLKGGQSSVAAGVSILSGSGYPVKTAHTGESQNSTDTTNNASGIEAQSSLQEWKANDVDGTNHWRNLQHGWKFNNSWKQNNWRRGRDATWTSKSGKNQWYEDHRNFDSCRSAIFLRSKALPASFSSATPPPQPWFGNLHAFHEECDSMGGVSEDMRVFTKVSFEGRLSLLSEAHILQGGEQMYLLRFSGGVISKADGVGFVFTNRLPCPKNIQKITSIFVNQRGQICLRVKSELVKFSVSLKPLDLGDVIGLSINLQEQRACFLVWPADGGPASTAEFSFGDALNACKEKTVLNSVSKGCFACIVKNVGVSVEMLS
mmetsp:Transcript_87685/g.151956  ORF Transcript_87685/g.151956 Transcript_87685/m.151956 type:complete len:439 (+) Transcript_87685:56-1372(+)